ncbi:MAG: hypothetical protein HQL52_15505, partial [Magnetococcales bacterium]|nr:hypothetical protein [Magnetococcales bacterium]
MRNKKLKSVLSAAAIVAGMGMASNADAASGIQWVVDTAAPSTTSATTNAAFSIAAESFGDDYTVDLAGTTTNG